MCTHEIDTAILFRTWVGYLLYSVKFSLRVALRSHVRSLAHKRTLTRPQHSFITLFTTHETITTQAPPISQDDEEALHNISLCLCSLLSSSSPSSSSESTSESSEGKSRFLKEEVSLGLSLNLSLSLSLCLGLRLIFRYLYLHTGGVFVSCGLVH